MTELTINQIIKIVIGVAIIAIIVGGIILFFNNTFFDFFKNIVPQI